MIEAKINYAMLKRGHDYRVMKEGYDWMLITTHGKSIYVPKWVFQDA